MDPKALKRKIDHVELALQQSPSKSAFDTIRLNHCALPSVNLNEIKLSTDCLGKVINAPLFVSSMTGGPLKAESINMHLAEGCAELGLAMGVGSQRIDMESGYQSGLGKAIRKAIGPQPLFANYGVGNLMDLDEPNALQKIIDTIEADALILHLNPIQEVFQHNGDTNWSGALQAIESVCRWSPIPIIAKEVGFGIDKESARQLIDSGISVIDVAGRGGTRFDDIEIARHPDIKRIVSTDSVFSNWGYSTVESLIAIASLNPKKPIWASGGIRNGLDVAKSLCLGANLAGIAGIILEPALQSTDAVVERLEQLISELTIACFGLGISNASDLSNRHIFEGV